MPPPKLSADAPVLDVAHPMVVDLGPAIREEAHLSRGGHGRLARAARRPAERNRLRAQLFTKAGLGSGALGALCRSVRRVAGRHRLVACATLRQTRLGFLNARILQEPLLAQARFD